MKIKSIYSTMFGASDENRLSVERAIHVSCILKEKIDTKKLQQAMHKALMSCPYIAYNVITENGNCYYCDNDLPIEFHDTPPQVLGGDDNNGHLVYLWVFGKHIEFYCSHALTDGRGLLWFADALLTYYFGTAGETVYCGSDKPDYFTDLMGSSLEVPEDYIFADYNVKDFFRIPEAGALKDMKSIGAAGNLKTWVFDYSADRKALDAFCAENKCSHSVALFHFLYKAVKSVHPEAGTVTCRMPVNARKIMGVENAFQNCSLNQVILSYPDNGAEKDSEAEVIAAIKAHMKQQLDPGHLAFCINQYAAYLKKDGNCDHFKDLFEGMDQSFMISDLGELLSEKDADKISFGMLNAFTGVPMALYMMTIGNRVIIEITQVFESGVYLEALQEVMDSYGIRPERIEREST